MWGSCRRAALIVIARRSRSNLGRGCRVADSSQRQLRSARVPCGATRLVTVVLFRELELAQLDLLQGLLDQPVHVQQGLCPTDIFQVRLGRRVWRREKPAAILVRLDRGLVGADLLRDRKSVV